MSKGEEIARVDPRIILAVERTLLAWIRTGLSLMGFGFAIARFGMYLREVSPDQNPGRLHFSVPFGILLVAAGIAANILAAVEHSRSIAKLRRGEVLFAPRISPAWMIAMALAVVGLVACAWILMS